MNLKRRKLMARDRGQKAGRHRRTELEIQTCFLGFPIVRIAVSNLLAAVLDLNVVSQSRGMFPLCHENSGALRCYYSTRGGVEDEKQNEKQASHWETRLNIIPAACSLSTFRRCV